VSPDEVGNSWDGEEPAEADIPIPDPQPEESPEAAGLFGATLSGGTYNPIPVASIGGLDIPGGPGALAAGQIVLDGLAITWGRSAVLEQPEPATGLLRIFDTTKRWAIDNDLRGQKVTVRFTGTVQGGGTKTGVYFAGRVGGSPKVSPLELVHPVTRQPIRGSLVELPLQSLLVDLANRVPIVDWPSETMAARTARIQAEAVAAGVIDGMGIRSFWGPPLVPAVAAADQVSILEHIKNLYSSCGGDRYSYFPGLRSIAAVPRKDYPSQRGLAQLWWDPVGSVDAARAGQGAYIRNLGVAPVGGATASPDFIDGAAVEYEPADGIARPPRVTRVQVQHKDSGTSWSTRTIEMRVTGTDETVSGIRTARVDSLVSWNNYADVALSDLEFMVRREGSAWVPGPVTLHTGPAGGFESSTQVNGILYGAETDDIKFLARSWFADYGIRPIFGVMGSTITYRKNEWSVEMNLAPITSTQPQHPITFEEIDDGSAAYELQWWDDDHPHGLHESVTFEDMGFVSSGLAVGTIPPNQGWDFLA
jgi:hypothetical protein